MGSEISRQVPGDADLLEIQYDTAKARNMAAAPCYGRQTSPTMPLTHHHDHSDVTRDTGGAV